MIQIEIAVPTAADMSKAQHVIEGCCKSVGLRTTLKGTLRAYPACVHWHFKKNKERGTLEITLWRKERRIWFSIQAGRRGVWIEEALARLEPAIHRRISKGKGGQRHSHSFTA